MQIFIHGRTVFEQRVFADGREWSVHWEQGAWNTGGCDFPTIEIVSIHSTNDGTFDIIADVTDDIDGTKLNQKIYEALEVALQEEREE